jgi:hypothetical protein
LVESPSFLQLRLQLLDSQFKHHTALLKSLHSLLLLIPQSSAYKTLSHRLGLVSALQMHKGFGERFGSYRENANANGSDNTERTNETLAFYDELTARFMDVLARHKPSLQQSDISGSIKEEDLLQADSNLTDQLRMIN